jgi:hypothetical protein
VRLTVAVTGPTGTFGHGLMPRLQADARAERVTGIARGRAMISAAAGAPAAQTALVTTVRG